MKKIRTHKPDRTPSQLDEVFGRPALLKGESRANYRALHKEISELMDPENFLDELEVREVADNIWEGQRFQSMATKLIDAEWRKAVAHLTDSRFGYVSEKSEEWLESIEGKPYPEGKTEADLLKRVGLNVALVQARALLMVADDLAVIDRLAANRISARKASLNEYERRKRLDAKEKRLAAKADLQHRDRANDNRPAEQRHKVRRRVSS